MAKPLKTKGMNELDALITRVYRQQGLGRIGDLDANDLIKHLSKIKTIIYEMHEEEDGE